MWNPGGNVAVLLRAKYNPYTLQEQFTIFLAYENVMESGNILLKETVFPHLWNTLSDLYKWMLKLYAHLNILYFKIDY